MMHIGNEWDALLADEIQKDYYLKLRQFLISEYTTRRIYPPMEDIFNALRHTSYSDVRAVILGQDPYHGPGQAHGMCWEQFTDRIIQLLNERQQPMVFLLWGGNARSKARLITNPAHLVLQCAHPSPLSAYNGFFGCRHFSKTNEFLVSRGMKPIDWKLD